MDPQTRHRVLVALGVVEPLLGAAAMVDLLARRTDPWDPETDPRTTQVDPVEVLLTALAELAAEATRSWDPVKHPRNPKGSSGGGRFRSTVDRLKDAIQAHLDGDGDGDPFEGFSREQLRLAAKKRGISLERGEDRDSIAKKLLADLGGKPRKPAPAPKKPSGGRKSGRDISGDVDYKSLPPSYNPKTDENDALKSVIHQQGFDGRPQVVTADDFDSAVERGEVRETWRGIGTTYRGTPPADMAEQYRTGDFYVGLGINGDGSYVAMSRKDAEYYGAEVLRIGLRKDARVISADDLDAEMDAYFAKFRRKSAALRELDEKLVRDLARARTPRARANIRRQYRADVYGLDADRSLALQRNPGVFAALRGYDAVEISKERSPDKHHEMIILNRTATIVQEA